MIVIRLRGGLGNQMFQYAFGKKLAEQFNTKLVIDLTALLRVRKKSNFTNRNYQLDIFNIEEEFLIAPNLIKTLNKLKLNFLIQLLKRIKLIGIKNIKEKNFHYDEDLITQFSDNKLYSGYWQSEKYFKSAENSLRNELNFKTPLSKNAQEILKKIKQFNSVCIHVRRGDYVYGHTGFSLLNLEYFIKASNTINSKEKNTHFFVFSDDPNWCKKNIVLEHDFTVVNYETPEEKFKEDLELMSNCNHFIMSASSFSWWAVWLSNTKNKAVVIAPKKWFNNESLNTKDIYMPHWILQ